MYIEGSPSSGKTDFLINKLTKLLLSGVKTSEIIVLCQNSHKKNEFLETIRAKLAKKNYLGSASLPIHTFNGVVYHTISKNWPYIEEMLSKNLGQKVFLPNLSGLGATEYLLKESIKKINKQDNLEDTFRDYASHKHLKQQLFRRSRLIAENNLSKYEIAQKSKLLEEQYASPTEKTLRELKGLSLKFRVLDYLNQTSIFLSMIGNGKINFNHTKYLLVDDFDELSFAAQFYVKNVIKDVKEFYITADPDGGSKRGYLCANPQGYEEIKTNISVEIVKLSNNNQISKISSDANKLFNSIKSGNINELQTIKLADNSVRQVEMMEIFFKKLKSMLFEEKISPDEILIAAPILNETQVHLLKAFFEKENIENQFFSGSKRILDDKIVFSTVILLQLINKKWHFPPKTNEVRTMLTNLTGIPLIYCKNILDEFNYKWELSHDAEIKDETSNTKYKKIINLIDEIRQKELSLQEQIGEIFRNIIQNKLTEKSNLENYNLMLNSLDEFQNIAKKFPKNTNLEKEWIVLIKDTVVSDNPASSPEIKPDCVKVATPQKIIDLGLKSKYQIWLDISNPVWFKEDIGPMYNSWVFSKNWNGQEYTPQIHRNLTNEKTAHVIRKLAYQAQEEILCFASQIDASGKENSGQLIKYLSGKAKKPQVKYEFTPREDQAPIFKYQSGEMAISAVPGAGKTKVLEALIIKMIMEDVDPEKILVLTYMDSAARNIRDRIKDSCTNLQKFPYISTIHGLGLSIIKDGDNYTRLNLNPDFQICDDSMRYKIMMELYNKFDMDISLNSFMNDYGAAISTIKQLEITIEEADKFIKNKNPELYRELIFFVPLYKEYQQLLQAKNMIDFDDLLIYSAKLLKETPEIKDYYREKFDYVIEDEAQDSSSIQQELLSLISKGNLIRCGDPNQAITSSFSPADVDNFKIFSKKSDNTIEMTGSQRCTKDVYELANTLVDWAESQSGLKGAFNSLHMKEIPGKNPDTKNSISTEIYPTQEEEKLRVTQEIANIKRSGKPLSIGVLLRGNKAVTDWAEYIEEQGISCICYSEAVGQKKVFRFLKTWLEVINNPWNNYFIKELYKEFSGESIIKTDFDSRHYLEKLGSPFICLKDEEIPTDSLKKFKSHIMQWLDKSDLLPENLTNELGDYYFKGVIDRSNARILSYLVGKFRNTYTDNEVNEVITLNEVVDHLRELATRKRLGGVSFFEEIEKNEHKSEFVQVMTVHKSKGLEFDVVFMPEVQEGPFYYPISPESIEIGDRDRMMNQIKQIKGKHLSPEKIKSQQIHEHLRLIYVGITRAKQYLYLSASEISDRTWTKKNKFMPSAVLESFMSDKPLFAD